MAAGNTWRSAARDFRKAPEAAVLQGSRCNAARESFVGISLASPATEACIDIARRPDE